MIKEQCTNRINDMLHVRNDKKDRITTDSLKRLRPQDSNLRSHRESDFESDALTTQPHLPKIIG
jgi:hypothetical protein